MTVPDKFKYGCVRVGYALIIIFVVRMVTVTATRILAETATRILAEASVYLLATDTFGTDYQLAVNIINFILQIIQYLLMYGGGILLTAWALDIKKSDLLPLAKKPKRLGKAVSWVVPSYGVGQLVNIPVIIILLIVFGSPQEAGGVFSPIGSSAVQINSVFDAVWMFVETAVIAPICEEIWFRGIIQTKLNCCGSAFAITSSALCFALAHGNLQQFFYTFAIGLFIGYVRYATGSLVPTVIIHAIINSISAIMIILVFNPIFVDIINKTAAGFTLSQGESMLMSAVALYLSMCMIFIIVGVFSAIGKLRNRRLYTPINNFPILDKGEKFKALIKTPEFIIGAALCIAYMFGLNDLVTMLAYSGQYF